MSRERVFQRGQISIDSQALEELVSCTECHDDAAAETNHDFNLRAGPPRCRAPWMQNDIDPTGCIDRSIDPNCDDLTSVSITRAPSCCPNAPTRAPSFCAPSFYEPEYYHERVESYVTDVHSVKSMIWSEAPSPHLPSPFPASSNSNAA